MSSTPIVRLHLHDNIGVATRRLPPHESAPLSDPPHSIVPIDEIPFGHKIALKAIPAGHAVIKYGQTIGFTTTDIEPGTWVHTHNVCVGELNLNYEFGTNIVPLPTPHDQLPTTFQGYRRTDGRAGTRNYLAIVSTVNCSATTSRMVVRQVSGELLARYPNVDGVIALVHAGGCAIQYGGEDHEQLARVLNGFATHPNVGASLMIGLGCETNHPTSLVTDDGRPLISLAGGESPRRRIGPVMTIQESGGIRKTVARAVAAITELLPELDACRRTSIPVSELILGTECGGSDGNSGLTANPGVGYASDLLVSLGGTSILAETPEIFGGEHLLTQRAASREVGEKLLARVQWWQDYAAKFGVELDNNPSVGNKKGGLTTIYEKSLGAIAKSGVAPLRAVYRYAEPVREHGFVFMDTPGYDPASVTGMIAGGANMIVFTTGRGSCFGCKPVPTLKVASNTPMFERMIEDMDVDAGPVLNGMPVAQIGEEIYRRIVAVASGEVTKSEAQGVGDEEFCPWTLGPVL